MELEKYAKLKAETSQFQDDQQLEIPNFQDVLQALEEKIQQCWNQSQIYDLSQQKEAQCIIKTKFISKQSDEIGKEFLKNSIMDIYKTLMPEKIIIAIMIQANNKIMAVLREQQANKKQLKKKLFKEQPIYEYFGLKIVMGYVKMQSLTDYFDESLIFQMKIFELFKEGRFKALDSLTKFNDSDLLKKNTRYNSLNQYQTIRICKKVAKIIKQNKQYQQELILTKNKGFVVDSQTQCCQIILSEANTQLILWSHFIENIELEPLSLEIVFMLQHFRNCNHIIYVYDSLLTLEQMIFLKLEWQISCIGIVENNELQTKLPIYHSFITLLNYEKQILAITDGTNQQEQNIQSYNNFLNYYNYYCLHTSRPIVSYQQYYSAVQSEISEWCIWNSYALTKLRQNSPIISYEEFRLNLSEMLLAKQIDIINKTNQMHKPKLSYAQVNTDITGEFGNGAKNAQQSKFHIPTLMAAPKQFSGSQSCIYCKKSTQLITQCKACSEISGRFVILCACDCFYEFHQNTHQYIINAECLTEKQLKQIEQSSQQLFYQAFQHKPGLMYENPKQVQIAQHVEID